MRERRTPQILAVVVWLALTALFFGGLGGVTVLLNTSLYGPGGFVLRYLDAVAADDLAAITSTPGVLPAATPASVSPSPSASPTASPSPTANTTPSPSPNAHTDLTSELPRTLLRPDMTTARPANPRIVSEKRLDTGHVLVTAEYTVGNSTQKATFELAPAPALYSVIHRWTFAHTPLAVLHVTVKHAFAFTVGSLTLDARYRQPSEALHNFSHTASYLALGGVQYSLSSQSPLVSAQAVSTITAPGGTASVTLDAQPTSSFTARVITQMREFLSECTGQMVLMPTGCPFGYSINDRVVSEPRWEITVEPQITLNAGNDTFEVPPASGVARLSVNVQSLFDGTIRPLVANVPFQISGNALIHSDGSIVVQFSS